MGNEKSQASRVFVSLPCTFGITEDTPRSGTATSLSVTGCFVKTRALAAKGDELFIKFWMPELRWLPLRGTVLYSMEGIGFGLRFGQLTPDEQNSISRLMETSSREKPVEGTGN